MLVVKLFLSYVEAIFHELSYRGIAKGLFLTIIITKNESNLANTSEGA